MTEPLKICYSASEIAPFAKTGGLADVSSALPRELRRQGHDVRAFFPRYSCLRDEPELREVEFARDVPVWFGGREYRFTLMTGEDSSTGLSLYFVDCPDLYDRETIYTSGPDEHRRFALLSRAVIESCQRMGWAPDVFHCNDWHTALTPLLLRSTYQWDSLFSRSRTLMTIHNIGYPGTFGGEAIGDLGLGEHAHLFDQQELAAGRMSFLRSGLLYADLVSTVSPTYAREIQTEAYGMGLDGLLRTRSTSLIGILNGVDYDEWSPESDPFIPKRYSAERLDDKRANKLHLLSELALPANADAPLVGMVTRLTRQKGIDLCTDVLPDALASTDLRVAVLGTGDARYEQMFSTLQQRFPGRLVYYRGYSNELAHLIEAGADMFLMPSLYEPCGLNQMFSLRYGTVPIVRKTGGLADSVRLFDERTGEGTGVVFEHYDARALARALNYAVGLYRNRPAWERLMRNGMAEDFSWERQARKYVEVYAHLAR
jgi:starch synthase